MKWWPNDIAEARKDLGQQMLETLNEVTKSESFGVHERNLLVAVLRSIIRTEYGVKPNEKPNTVERAR